jgi:orotidine-5'-phosphate decarboxylase
MTFIDMLRDAQRRNGSMLCVGLDPGTHPLPRLALKGDAGNRIYDFCARIVDATADLDHRVQAADRLLCRPPGRGPAGAADVPHAPRGAPRARHPGRQARRHRLPPPSSTPSEAFERYGADAVTLSPFMGFDSVQPYLKHAGKGAFLLCRTSNPGGDDLQNQRLSSVEGAAPASTNTSRRLAQGPWNLNGQLGLVVGATYPAEIERVRALAPTLPLLIPGVGAQGGDAAATVRAGWRARTRPSWSIPRGPSCTPRVARISPRRRVRRRCARASCWRPRAPERTPWRICYYFNSKQINADRG